MVTLRVLIISTMYPHPLVPTYGIFVHQQMAALTKLGCQVVVICPVPWAPFPLPLFRRKWKEYARAPRFARKDNIDVYYPRFLLFPRKILISYSGNFLYLGIKRTMHRLEKKLRFDIIHAHGLLPEGWAALALTRKRKLPVIVTTHGKDVFMTSQLNNRCRQILNNIIRSVDAFVLVSRRLLHEAQNHLNLSAEELVIYNGFDSSVLSIIEPEEVFCSESVRIVSVSNLIERKGVRDVVLAVNEISKRVESIEYTIVGIGPEKRHLESLIEKHDIKSKIKIKQIRSHEQAMRELARADIFCLPARDESFGIVYIEALAFGKPVIACAGEGIEEIIKPNKFGMLVPWGDQKCLVEAIEFLIGHPLESREMGNRGREYVYKHLSWENNAHRYMQVYRGLIEGQSTDS